MTSVVYEKETCGRCGGCGHYSYNQITGTRCFGCGGTGERLSKRGRAAKAFADAMLDVPVQDVPQGQQAVYRDALTGRKVTFSGTRVNGGTKVKTIRDTEWREVTTYALLMRQEDGTMKEASVGLSAGIKVRLIPTDDQIKQIAEYQDSLTKAGKPRKVRA